MIALLRKYDVFLYGNVLAQLPAFDALRSTVITWIAVKIQMQNRCLLGTMDGTRANLRQLVERCGHDRSKTSREKLVLLRALIVRSSAYEVPTRQLRERAATVNATMGPSEDMRMRDYADKRAEGKKLLVLPKTV